MLWLPDRSCSKSAATNLLGFVWLGVGFSIASTWDFSRKPKQTTTTKKKKKKVTAQPNQPICALERSTSFTGPPPHLTQHRTILLAPLRAFRSSKRTHLTFELLKPSACKAVTPVGVLHVCVCVCESGCLPDLTVFCPLLVVVLVCMFGAKRQGNCYSRSFIASSRSLTFLLFSFPHTLSLY